MGGASPVPVLMCRWTREALGALVDERKQALPKGLVKPPIVDAARMLALWGTNPDVDRTIKKRQADSCRILMPEKLIFTTATGSCVEMIDQMMEVAIVVVVVVVVERCVSQLSRCGNF